MPKRSSRQSTPLKVDTIPDQLDVAHIQRLIESSKYAWPERVYVLTEQDLIVPTHELSGMKRQDYSNQGHPYGEAQLCFRSIIATAPYASVIRALDLWSNVFARMFVHPVSKGFPKHVRYNLTWAIFGYVNNQDPAALKLLNKLG